MLKAALSIISPLQFTILIFLRVNSPSFVMNVEYELKPVKLTFPSPSIVTILEEGIEIELYEYAPSSIIIFPPFGTTFKA